MSDSIPYLGSKISLISKSEIRYEGILYTIDAQDSIIALAKVQSFGTENRPTEMPVPAKSDIYEYIIFRGTDIKTIEVCDTPKPQMPGVHNDPAIVGLQVQQNSNAPIGASTYPSTSFGHQPLGPIGSAGSYYGNFGNQLGQNIPSSGFSLGGAVSQASELSNDIGGISIEPQSPSRSNRTVPTPIGVPPQTHKELPRSRSSTPSISRKSPVVDAGVQVSPQRVKPQPTQPPQDKKKNTNQNATTQQQRQPPPLLQSNNERFTKETSSSYSRRSDSSGGYNNQGQNQAPYQHSQNQRGYHGYQQQQSHYQQQYRPGHMNRGRGSNRRGGPTRGRPGAFNQGSRQRQQDQQLFDKEFDFEQANEQFEEMRTQFAKTKIGDSENGGGEGEKAEKDSKKDEKKEDSGHETATTGDESEDSASSVYYDKTKSFFDNISCEALERSKGKTPRSDWRQERKINVQTFGVASARRGYFPRGRGGYYPRGSGGGSYHARNYGQGGYYRGGNQGGYRSGPRGGGSGYYYGQSNYNRNQGRQEVVNGSPSNDASAPTRSNGGEGSSYASALRGSGSK